MPSEPSDGIQNPVFQGGQAVADAVQAVGIDVCRNNAFALGQYVQHVAPRIDNHAVSERAPSVFVQTALCRRHDVTLVFDGTRAQQQLPMRLARRVRKRSGQHQYVKRQLASEKFGKADIVTNARRHRHAFCRQVRHIPARADGIGFGIAFAQTGKTEEVHFVVQPRPYAVPSVHQQRIHHFTRLAALQRHSPAEQHHAAFFRRFAQCRLKASAAQRLGKREFVGIVCAHQHPIFGQQHPIRTLLRRPCDQAFHGGDVGFRRHARHHLHGGNSDFVHFFSFFLPTLRHIPPIGYHDGTLRKPFTQMPILNHIALIGVGLIGGSFVLDLKRQGLVRTVTGIDTDRDNLERALERGVIDQASVAIDADSIGGADLVLIATPVATVPAILTALRPVLPEHTWISDVGSTKSSVIEAFRRCLPDRLHHCIAAHPIAGSDRSGAQAAQFGLFRHRKLIITPHGGEHSDGIALVENLWHAVGAEIYTMDAQRHDAVFAAVSHMPHLTAFAYVHQILDHPDGQEYLKFAATGFRDFTRIASGHPAVWADICLANKDSLLQLVQGLGKQLDVLANILTTDDREALYRYFEEAKTTRDRWLDGN
ncbi:oxidoreductase [Neisseria meningitidis]|nr:oxidoreductase [Neisseria meningitidis]CWR03799.1 oxidoreductase [Neisseria meningitidis]CWR03912.1 oxidoreductase [Neisseria meningitidis]CWR62222.1 oxidoreductase [Neisseria meningitidis]